MAEKNYQAALAPTSDFEITPGVVHLAITSTSPVLKEAFGEGLKWYAQARSGGTEHELVNAVQRCRELAGEIFDCDAASASIQPSVAHSAGIILSAVLSSRKQPWWRRAKPVIVTTGNTYPSSSLQAVRLAELGEVELRLVPGDEIVGSRIVDAIDNHVSVVMLDHADYISGRLLLQEELVEIRRKGEQHGAVMILDVSQTAGVVPVPIGISHFIVCTGYKWLFAPHDVALMVANRERVDDLLPTFAGWHNVEPGGFPVRLGWGIRFKPDAQRWEPGGLPNLGAAILAKCLSYRMDLGGQNAIGPHVQALCDILWEGLTEQEYPVLTPQDSSRRTGFISIQAHNDREVAEALAELGIITAPGYGRVRFSPAVYTSSDDIEKALEACRKVRPTLRLR